MTWHREMQGCDRFFPCISGLTPPYPQHTCYTTPWHTARSSCQAGIMATWPGALTTLCTLLNLHAHSALLSGTRQARVQQLRLTYTAYDTHPTPGKSSRTCQQHADTAETEKCRPVKAALQRSVSTHPWVSGMACQPSAALSSRHNPHSPRRPPHTIHHQAAPPARCTGVMRQLRH